MLKSQSIALKVMVYLVVLVIIMAIGFYLLINHLHVTQLRNEVRTVAEQVVAFRSWVAGCGVVWVKDAETEFLGQHPGGDESMFYSKNPALATRELSNVVNTSSARTSFTVTSTNFRNVKNKPDDFEKEAQNKFEADKSLADLDTRLDNEFRFAKPLTVKKACLKCHGSPEDAPADVIEKYGDKYGFGYKEGDIRGIISVRIPMAGLWGTTLKEVGIWILLLFLLSLFITYVFARNVFISPIQSLTTVVDEVSLGEKTELDVSGISDKTSNELEKLALAVHRLAASTQLAIKKLRKK